MPEKVEEKIRYLIRKFPNTEWSGVLFYKRSGSFENNDLLLTCEDIFPMDLGSTGFTEFSMTPEVSHYIAEHIELFDCEIGNVHSHHTMGAFFSGTDDSTLRSGGNDTNCWLMLIVDTRGQYVARITRKVSLKKEVTIKDLGSSYEFFGDGKVELSPNNKKVKQNIEREEIEYYDLNVERQVVPNPLSSLDDRFDEIVKKKAEEKSQNTPWTSLWNRNRPEAAKFNYPTSLPTLSNRKVKNESYNPFESLYDTTKPEQPAQKEVADDEWYPVQSDIHDAVCKMIACSLILNVERFDLKQWITKYMNKRYDSLFSHDAFDEWLDFAVNFFVYNYDDGTAPEDIDIELYYGAVASAMIEELSPYDNGNYPYIQKYITELESIIV